MPIPLHYTLFCVVNVVVLKYVNSIVQSPYMVIKSFLCPVIYSLKTHARFRMNRSIFPKPKRIVAVNGQLGIQKSRHHQDCVLF